MIDGERKEFTINNQPYAARTEIREENLNLNPLRKQCVELMVRDVLRANPNLSFYRDLIILTESKNVINIATERHSIEFFPGFRTCYMNIMAGSFLNVTIKNRILSSKTINELIQG